MKPSLQLKLSQHLALTPQLQQSIRLLQLSTLELNQELEQILAENPLLERLDDPLPGALAIAPNGGLDAGTAAHGSDAASHDGQAGGDEAPATGENDWADERWTAGADDGDWGSATGTRTRSDDGNDERDWPQLDSGTVTLREHLISQLAAMRLSQRDKALVTLLIEELNEDGLLETGLDELAAALPEELGIEPEELSAALKLVQSFDPAGVAARDLRECLLLQLDSDDFSDRPARLVRTAREIVDGHLDELAARDFLRIKHALHCDDDTLRAAQALIRQLNPRPGASFAGEAPAYVVPDVIVRESGSGWTVSLNPAVMPRLRINEMYADVLRRNRGSHTELSGQLQEARWLVKNVQQRFDTIQRVAQAIVDRQRAFLAHGEVAMRPLVLREIADTLGLHESTISRVTTQKYMLTPLGTFELKYFFGSHVATDSGGAASSTAIRALIRQLVSAEDSAKPLSDGRIAEILGEQGFVVARRTVAKYREALRIPPVSQRRSL